MKLLKNIKVFFKKTIIINKEYFENRKYLSILDLIIGKEMLLIFNKEYLVNIYI